MNLTNPTSPVNRPHGRVVLGIALICFGLLFLGYRLNMIPIEFISRWIPLEDPWRLWPMILVIMGLSKLAQHGILHGKGHFLLAMGTSFQILMLERENFFWTWWPMLLVWWGLVVTLRALIRPAASCSPSADPSTVERDSDE